MEETKKGRALQHSHHTRPLVSQFAFNLNLFNREGFVIKHVVKQNADQLDSFPKHFHTIIEDCRGSKIVGIVPSSELPIDPGMAVIF